LGNVKIEKRWSEKLVEIIVGEMSIVLFVFGNLIAGILKWKMKTCSGEIGDKEEESEGQLCDLEISEMQRK